MTVDLERQVAERPGMAPVPFRIDSRRRSSRLKGLDTTLLERLQHGASAEAMRERDRRLRPWITTVPIVATVSVRRSSHLCPRAGVPGSQVGRDPI